eukprot:TCONS_00063637-protein
MNLALKLLTTYVLCFTTLTTFFIVYNLRNIPNNNGNLILQNIICNDDHGRRFSKKMRKKFDSASWGEARPADKFTNLKDGRDEVPSLIKLATRLPSSKEKESTEPEGLNEIIKTIKRDIFSLIYKDPRLRYDKELQPDLSKFKEPFSLFSEDQILLRSIFRAREGSIDFDNDRIQKQISLKIKRTDPSKKLILLMFKSNDLNEHGLVTNKCHHKDCIFTNDVSEAENADVIVFNGPSKQMIDHTRNRKNQIWIYHTIESPVHNLNFDTPVQINWTATYRSDSTIPTPYAKFVPFEHIERLPYVADKNYATGKIKLAAFVVSNCDAENGRLDYIWELKKFASVDIYGACGDLKCNRDECFEVIKKDYKFYMAFENSNCREYITEKFFRNALQHDVIPIVMGAHPDDYKRVAPPNSFIHVDEFNSPRQLAEYMHILDNNDDLYNEYFRWKGTGEFINSKFVCRVCAMVQATPSLPFASYDINKMLTSAKHQCLSNDPTNNKWFSWKRKKLK